MRDHLLQKKNGSLTPKKSLAACPGCDILLELSACDPGETLLCPRCGQLLAKPRKNTVIRTCALSLMGLFLFIPANFLPLFTFDIFGIKRHGSIVDSVMVLYQQEYFFVAVLVCFTSLVFPLLKLGLLFFVSFNLMLCTHFSRSSGLLRWYHYIQEWGMVEIYLIGILVTVVKMYHMAAIHYNTGFFCYTALVAAVVGVSFVFDKRYFWTLIGQESFLTRNEKNGGIVETGNCFEQQVSGLISGQTVTAKEAGMVNCRICHYLFPGDNGLKDLRCPRCRSVSSMRIPNSVNRTKALLITAVIFAFPANLLPVMEVNRLGVFEKSTIMDGIIYFFQHGSYGIGFVIFTASVLVPLFKIIGLLIILNSIYFNRMTRLRHKTAMFRLITFIGRWSMLDIFVIALLCAVVHFGFFTSITIAPAAPFFAAVVVATMFAAISFDSRLLWDRM